MRRKFEDTKVVIRNRKMKNDRQYNGQNKRTNNDQLTLHRKQTPLKTEDELWCWRTIISWGSPSVTFVTLLLDGIIWCENVQQRESVLFSYIMSSLINFMFINYYYLSLSQTCKTLHDILMNRWIFLMYLYSEYTFYTICQE